MAEKRSGFIGGLAAGVVATALIGSAISEYWFFGEGSAAVLQPETGGIQLVETPAVVLPTGGEQNNSPTPNPLIVDQQAIVSKDLLLYADAGRSSLILDEIAAGTTVTINKPSGEYSSYPVEKESQLWVRVRTQDGLVGWVDVEMLEIDKK